MTEEEMHWISSNLGPLLKAETKLSNKEAYRFATDFVKLLKLKYWGIDEFGDVEDVVDLPTKMFVQGE